MMGSRWDSGWWLFVVTHLQKYACVSQNLGNLSPGIGVKITNIVELPPPRDVFVSSITMVSVDLGWLDLTDFQIMPSIMSQTQKFGIYKTQIGISVRIDELI